MKVIEVLAPRQYAVVVFGIAVPTADLVRIRDEVLPPFYEKVSGVIAAHGGKLLKVQPDGLIGVFDHATVHGAVEAAISFLDGALRDRARGVADPVAAIATGAGRQVMCHRSETEAQMLDIIGAVSDMAAHLRTIANPGALLLTRSTVEYIIRDRLVSPVGEVAHRAYEDYIGPVLQTELPSSRERIDFVELMWSDKRFGVSGLSSVASAGNGSVANREAARRVAPRSGTVSAWDERNGRGRVIASDGTVFYVNSQLIAHNETQLTVGSRCWFLPQDPLPNGKNPVASACVQLGALARGRVYRIHPKGYGFLRSKDGHGNEINMILIPDADVAPLGTDDDVEFVVGENEKGPAAIHPKALAERAVLDDTQAVVGEKGGDEDEQV